MTMRELLFVLQEIARFWFRVNCMDTHYIVVEFRKRFLVYLDNHLKGTSPSQKSLRFVMVD